MRLCTHCLCKTASVHGRQWKHHMYANASMRDINCITIVRNVPTFHMALSVMRDNG